MNNVKELYSLWLENAVSDPDLKGELQNIKDNEDEIFDRFYKSLVLSSVQPV